MRKWAWLSEMASVVVPESDSVLEASRENTSDEDTEDASEPEMVKMDIEDCGKSGSLEEKVAVLKAQLKQLEEGTYPDYLGRVHEIEDMREKRLFVAEVFKQYELDASEAEFERERLLATQELDSKKLELKECLLHELQEKKKAYETYRHSMELCSGVDSFEPKHMVTRKLRRRHYDPLPVADKRRKPAPLSSVIYVLDENEVEDDLKLIYKGKVMTNTRSRSSPVPVSSNDGGAIYEAKIEDGKLYYESRAFHKGQHIFIESKEHGQESGVITSISQNEIWVKRLPDNSKLRIYLTQLTRGKYVLKRRSA